MQIQELIKSLGNKSHFPALEPFDVCGLSCNSRQVGNNYIFVAIKGTRQDGNRFIDEAINRGARLVISQKPEARSQKPEKVSFISVKNTRRALGRLASEFYGNPSAKIKVIGITGTNGKTTISYLIEAILKEAKFNPAVIGTINYRFNNRFLDSKNTTPGPVELQSMLLDMLKENIDYAVMEVSSHALDQDRTEGIKFKSAIFTNLTQDHLDYHKTLNNYFNAKAKLFSGMDAEGFAVINNDDKFAPALKRLTKARVITYGLRNESMVMAEDIKTSTSRSEFKLTAPSIKEIIKTNLLGLHNVYNILAAIAWGLGEGIDKSVIRSAIEKFELVPGRLERIDCGKGISAFVDYAHTEDALKNVLTALRPLTKKMIIVVFGCGGERDKTKRPRMGKVVTELADFAIITNDNPRSEDPLKIIEDIRRGIRNKRNFCVVPERALAIKKSLSLAKSGDIVLVAGKGHETYQIIRDKLMHFDDREAIRECLKSASF